MDALTLAFWVAVVFLTIVALRFVLAAVVIVTTVSCAVVWAFFEDLRKGR